MRNRRDEPVRAGVRAVSHATPCRPCTRPLSRWWFPARRCTTRFIRRYLRGGARPGPGASDASFQAVTRLYRRCSFLEQGWLTPELHAGSKRAEAAEFRLLSVGPPGSGRYFAGPIWFADLSGLVSWPIFVTRFGWVLSFNSCSRAVLPGGVDRLLVRVRNWEGRLRRKHRAGRHAMTVGELART